VTGPGSSVSNSPEGRWSTFAYWETSEGSATQMGSGFCGSLPLAPFCLSTGNGRPDRHSPSDADGRV